MSKNSNNGNYKKRYEQLIKSYQMLRQAYENETGKIYNEHDVDYWSGILDNAQQALKQMKENEK